jgi:uncharacterized damage-inducible protein DinB
MRLSGNFRALNLGLFMGCCLLVGGGSKVAVGQAAAPAKPAVGTVMAPPQVYGKLLSLLEEQFVGAAEAMPEDKYDFAPPATAGEFKGVRTFGEEVKHVAQANGYFFHDPTKPMVDTKADFDKLKTKAEIVKALKDSFVQAHAYVDGITAENAFVMTANGTRGGMAAFGIAHFMDHYGQMVEYLRMNGVVPPGSK